MAFWNNNNGMRCDPTPDGKGLNCKLFEANGNDKLATGTDVTVVADPVDNCEPRIVGTVDIMQKDEKKVAEIANLVRKNCRRGIQ